MIVLVRAAHHPRAMSDDQHGAAALPVAPAQSRTCASCSASSCDVASSRISNGASFRNARAIAMRCRSPPDSIAPRSPISVSYPCGRRCTNSCAAAALAAAIDVVVARAGARHADVLGDGAGEQVRPLRHPGDAVAPCFDVDLPQIRPAGEHRSRVGLFESQQQAHDRRLARSRWPDKRRHRARRKVQRHVRERRRSLRAITERHMLEANVTRRRDGARAGHALWLNARIDDGEQPLSRCPACRPGVILRRQVPQRQEELRRDHEHRERPREADVAVHEPQADLDRHERRRKARAQLQHQRRLERRAQHVHRRLAVVLARLAQVSELVPAAPEHLQRRQALQHVQERRAQPAQLREPPRGDIAGAPADERQEHQQQRPRRQQDQHRPSVDREHDRGHHQRHRDRERARRLVRRHVFVEVLDAAPDRVRQLPAPLAARVRRPERADRAPARRARAPPSARSPRAGPARRAPTAAGRARGRAQAAPTAAAPRHRVARGR